VKKEEREEM